MLHVAHGIHHYNIEKKDGEEDDLNRPNRGKKENEEMALMIAGRLHG